MHLLIVHPSSLDSLTWHEGQVAAVNLVNAIIAATQSAEHVVVMDQGWELSSDSTARKLLYAHLTACSRVTWFEHDEDSDGWSEPMPRLANILRGLGIDELTLAGVWATEDGQSGCVNATAEALVAHGITCRIAPDLCGYEADEEVIESRAWLAEWKHAGDDMDCPNCGQPQLKTLDQTTACYGCGWTEHNPAAA